jgi:subtilase family serine protease
MSLRTAVALAASILVGASLAPAASAASMPATGCATVAPSGYATCEAIRVSVGAAPAVTPAVTPTGFGPKDLLSAYDLPSTGGGGATVAIVDAYNDPAAAADLAVYRSQYGLPACTVANGCFRQVNQAGATSPLPANDPSWAGEESLALDMVSAICAHCHILLVEAASAADKNLFAAVDEAVTLGAKEVSIGWGAAETGSETASDVHFNHPGVAITAPSGSDGSPTYPGSSRYVTAVGSTTLARATNARGWTESASSGSGSGCSPFEVKPAWQAGVATGCTRRAVSDVAAVGDPSTGVAVYETYGASGWVVFAGGSVPPPIIAGVYALAGPPAAGTYPASYPYADPGGLYDITTGPGAGAGWDGPTGLGTPDGTSAFKA